MHRYQIIYVGAVYIDTILTIPHFPIEDEKLRAKNSSRRRGGNTANTLEVLAQLVEPTPVPTPLFPSKTATTLHLLTVLPARKSPATTFIRASLPHVNIDEASLFRPRLVDAAESYILCSEETQSRTIVSVNNLPEMQVEEFKEVFGNIGPTTYSLWRGGWFHFEGRIPDVTRRCVEYLRGWSDQVLVSVECEKPERKGLEDVARLADVVFYSKLWAEKKGYDDPRAFLADQVHDAREGAVLCCTWGKGGAVAVMTMKGEGTVDIWARVEAWRPEASGEGDGVIVDTIGAGDTFIAGMIFALNNRDEWPLQRKLEFANQLAGRKVRQDGFKGLGGKIFENGGFRD